MKIAASFFVAAMAPLSTNAKCKDETSILRDLTDTMVFEICGEYEDGVPTYCNFPGIPTLENQDVPKDLGCEWNWPTMTANDHRRFLLLALYGEDNSKEELCLNGSDTIEELARFGETELELAVGHLYAAIYGPKECVPDKIRERGLDDDPSIDLIRRGCEIGYWRIWKQIKEGEPSCP